ncbi:MAG: type I restriction enzyme HsdR N-terminal domain-containing protein, partial [Actinobacteria bacterium]|nr:type I restriction enzyme HsdR N-terminal domain-containing protein [Actinomycetota bacterium]
MEASNKLAKVANKFPIARINQALIKIGIFARNLLDESSNRPADSGNTKLAVVRTHPLVEYPKFAHQIKSLDQKEQIFDPFRKIWVRLTPEEWVRQNFLQVLVQKHHVPASLIAVEKEIKWGETKKRFDILVYKDTKPWLIVECKEMNVP